MTRRSRRSGSARRGARRSKRADDLTDAKGGRVLAQSEARPSGRAGADTLANVHQWIVRYETVTKNAPASIRQAAPHATAHELTSKRTTHASAIEKISPRSTTCGLHFTTCDVHFTTSQRRSERKSLRALPHGEVRGGQTPPRPKLQSASEATRLGSSRGNPSNKTDTGKPLSNDAPHTITLWAVGSALSAVRADKLTTASRAVPTSPFLL